MIATATAVREQLWLKTPIEGCARYQGDVYQRTDDSLQDIPGNPWFISTLWLAEYCIDQAENQQASIKHVDHGFWQTLELHPSK